MPKAQEWQLQEAKSRFSEVVRQAQLQPQTITLHGKPSAVVISFSDYRQLTQPKRSLIDVMRGAPKAFLQLDLSRDDDSALREAWL